MGVGKRGAERETVAFIRRTSRKEGGERREK